MGFGRFRPDGALVGRALGVVLTLAGCLPGLALLQGVGPFQGFGQFARAEGIASGSATMTVRIIRTRIKTWAKGLCVPGVDLGQAM